MTTSDIPAVARRHHRGWWIALGVVGAVVVAFAACEAAGWPFLAGPAERWLSRKLDRPIAFGDGEKSTLRLHLLGGVRLSADSIRIDNPPWSALGPMMTATNATLKLRYRDLFALRRGEPLHVDRLGADTMALAIERRADGSASWQFGDRKPDDREPSKFSGVRFGDVSVKDGKAVIVDAPLKVRANADFSFSEDGDAAGPASAASAAAPAGLGLRGRADGTYNGLPLHATLRAGSTLLLVSAQAKEVRMPVQLRVEAGRAHLFFDGGVSDPLGGLRLDGRYDVAGPSLAAVGEPFGLTLPTTHEFEMQGKLDRVGNRWHSVVERATIGRSRLNGDFAFDNPPGKVPMLTGKLGGPLMVMQDLGPVVGTSGGPPTPKTPKPSDHVLPNREFDLPSLRAMNADVAFAIDRFESGSPRLEAVQPLLGRVKLQDGVLDIDRLDARLAQGHIRGNLRLDGREKVARWQAQLVGSGLEIEQWVLQPRKNGAAPYATGSLGARVDVQGRGRSTAELLGSANGRAVVHWTHGTMSHLAVEAMGIDVAQGLGVLLSGDKPLPVTCAAGDFAIRQGQVTPTVLLVDTPDSTIWMNGSVSLASEEMHLVARVDPKDVSPLALRTPVHVDGRLNAPQISLEKAPLLKRLLPAAALATLNPLAALLPLIDTGDDEGRKAAAACESVGGGQRGKEQWTSARALQR